MFAVLYIADFSLNAVLRTEPQLPDWPAALLTPDRKKPTVVALNTSARALGVALHMTSAQALARCPTILLRTPQPAAEAEARAALLAVSLTLAPCIEDTGPGLCTIDLRGAPLGRVVSAATTAVEQLTPMGLPTTAGIASTPLLALYAARQLALPPAIFSSGSPDPVEGKLTESCPRRVKIIREPRAFLAPLPLATADPSPQLAEILAQWGLRTLGDLTALPRDDFIRRFGAEGRDLWHRALGGAPRPLCPITPPQQFIARFEFEHTVETLEPLLFLLRRFLDRLTLELETSQQVAAELILTLQMEDDRRHERRFRLPEPTSKVEILFRTLHTHLESLQTASAIVALDLRIEPTRPLVRQQDLYETGLRDPHGFAETLARVVAIVGSDRVGTPRFESTHRPDAIRLVPPLDVIPLPPVAPIWPEFGLALRRFRPPLPAQLHLTEQQPTYVETQRFSGSIVDLRGPWHSNGEWWQQDRAWARIEWDIALAEGGLYRLSQIDNRSDAWFIEGEYD